jgi:putative ABC transport system permease protein
MLRVAWRSLLYRRGAVALTVATIAVSVFTLLGTEHIRQAAKQSFNSTLSGVDLIVGPRTSEINLLLTTVFRIGNPSQNMSWKSYQTLLAHESVDWAIPISLGDSHKGFRVIGTQKQFFTKFHYGQARPLVFNHGQSFSGLYDVVLGAQVAQQLEYSLSDSLILAHGIAATSFHSHDADPFTVVGILEPTGTPVDNALYVSLDGLEAIHHHEHSSHEEAELEPDSITSAMVGLKSKLATFKIQRLINTSTDEPLTAVLPGVALTELWQMSRGLESTLQLMASLMLFASLLGLGAMMLATLRERRYEIAILRTLGAGAKTLFLLIQIESIGVALLGIVLGSATLALVIATTNRFIVAKFGIDISLYTITFSHALILLYVLVGAILIGFLPAFIGFLKSRRPM